MPRVCQNPGTLKTLSFQYYTKKCITIFLFIAVWFHYKINKTAMRELTHFTMHYYSSATKQNKN